MKTSPIKKFRKENGLTLEQFGKLMKPNVLPSTVMRWERKVPAERVVEIERATGILRDKLRPDLFEELGAQR